MTYLGGPLLVLAGAGSGKTRVLAHRIAYLVAAVSVAPYEVLAVTFTNKAAGEMAERVRGLLGTGTSGIWMGTFHSICARMLRYEAKRYGIMPDFTIYDEQDQHLLMKRVLMDLGVSDNRLTPSSALQRVSKAKSNLISSDELDKTASSPFDRKLVEVYRAYDAALRANNALDFDDLIAIPVRLLSSYGDMLERYAQRFKHILIDEYQDTNKAQYELVKLLCSHHRNVCAVGDDDQSIYRWRGANIGNILNFEHDFPDARIIRLEQSYRSTKTIVAASQAVIKNNRKRKPKGLWTENDIGNKLLIAMVADEQGEGGFIADTIASLTASGHAYADFVVLYRTNAQSRALEDTLRRQAIPYVIVGGLKFYERKEIKDIVAYLKLIANPRDSVSLLRIINVPNRGIGDVTIDRLKEFASEAGISLCDTLSRIDEIGTLTTAQRQSLHRFAIMIEEMRSKSSQASVPDLVSFVAERSGYLDHLKRQGTVEAISRMENIEELVAGAYEFAERSDEPTLGRFLEEVSLVMDIDLWDDRRDAVSLMTLHNAKGLEFPVVFIAGAEEGLLPHHTSLQDEDELEEERRLFYVGLTRAKRQVFITMAIGRRTFHGWMARNGSRFLAEIPGEFAEFVDHTLEGSRSETNGWEPELVITRGMKVKHPDWGIGRVMACEGYGKHLRLIVRFERGGTKRLLAHYADLEVVEDYYG